MAQQDYVLDGTLDAVPYGAELQASFQAQATLNSGTVFPPTSYPFQLAVRTDSNSVWQRDSASAVWRHLWTPGQSLNNPSLNELRLSVASGTPFGAQSSAATALFWTPAVGNQVCLYDATALAWTRHTLSEQAISLTGLASGVVYDVFVFATAQNTVNFELLAWSSFSTRATALTSQDGVWVKLGQPNRRYLGSFVTVATGQTQLDAACIGVWNAANRSRTVAYRDLVQYTTPTTVVAWQNTPDLSTVPFLVGLPGQSLSSTALLHLLTGSADYRIALTLGNGTAPDGRSARSVNGSLSPGLYNVMHVELDAAGLEVGYSDVRITQSCTIGGTTSTVFGSAFSKVSLRMEA